MADSTPARLDPTVPGPYQKREQEEAAQQSGEKKKKLSPEDLRKELDAKSALMQMRVEAIKGELARVPDDAKKAVQKAVFTNPWVALGGSLALGLVVGLLVGKKRVPQTALSKALEYVPASQRHLAERYVHELQQHLRRAARKGEDAADAARDFVSRHAPPVIVSVEEPKASGGGLGGALGGILVTLLTTFGKTAVTAAITAVTAKVSAEEGSRQGTKAAQEGR